MKKLIKKIKKNVKEINKYITFSSFKYDNLGNTRYGVKLDTFDPKNKDSHNPSSNLKNDTIIKLLTKNTKTDKLKGLYSDKTYSAVVFLTKKEVNIEFLTMDWRGDRDCSFVTSFSLESIDNDFLLYIDNVLTSFINENIETIYKEKIKLETKKKVEKFRLNNFS